MGRGPWGRSLRGRSRRCPAQRRGWGPRQGLRGPESLPAARREDRGAQRAGGGPSAAAAPRAAPVPPPPPPPPPSVAPESLRGAGADPDPEGETSGRRPGPERAEDGGERGAAARARDPASLPLSSPQRSVRTRGPPCPDGATPARRGRPLPRGMPRLQPRCPHLLLLLLLAWQPQAPSAQVMDFLFEKWKLYGDQCLYNLSLLPPPTGEPRCLPRPEAFTGLWSWESPVPPSPHLQSWSVTERLTSIPAGRTPLPTPRPTSPAPGTSPGTAKHRFVFKRCGPDGQWVRGPRGQPWRNASQCQVDDEELAVQKEAAQMYSSFQVMYTVGYSLSLGALLLALAILLGLSKLHCTRNYIHVNLFTSFVLKASSVLAIDALLKTRYSQRIGDDLSVSVWLSDGAVAGCRVAAVFMQYGVVANYCWLLVEGLYLHGLLGLAAAPGRSCFGLYLGIGWGAPMLFVIPWAVVKCLFENIQCWTSNDNMAFWWILRFPVFLAILINFFIFIRILHVLVAKLRAHQMRYTDYKLRLAKSTLTLIPLLGVHEVVFAFVTDEHAQGALRSTKLFFDLFLSSFQGLLVAVLYCFLNKEVQSELLRRWHRWHEGKALHNERHMGGGHMAQPASGPPSQKLLLSRGGGSSNGTSQDPSAETCLAGGLPGLAESPF
nr:glucagon receptor isoform X2 [Camelus dromedarius]